LGEIFSLRRILQADHRDYGWIAGEIVGNGGFFLGEIWEEGFDARNLDWVGDQWSMIRS